MSGLVDLKYLLDQGKRIEGKCYHLAKLYETRCEDPNSCEKKKSNWWCCDEHYRKMPFSKAEKTLIAHVKSVIKDVEKHPDNIIEEFTIGKTYVGVNLTSDYFSPDQPSTWDAKCEGIDRRWKDYKNDGYHCLVVICCITKEIPEQRINEKNNVFPIDQEQFALVMEQKLIHYFRLAKPNSKLGNKSFATGKGQDTPLRGGIVYVAFKFKKDGGNVSQISDKPIKNTSRSSGDRRSLQTNQIAKKTKADKTRKKKLKKVFKSKPICSTDSSSSESQISTSSKGEKETSNVSEKDETLTDQVSANEMSVEEDSATSNEEGKDKASTEQFLSNDSEHDDGRTKEPRKKRERMESSLPSDSFSSSISITTVTTSDLSLVEQSMTCFTNTSVSSTFTTPYNPISSCSTGVNSTDVSLMNDVSNNSSELPNPETLPIAVQEHPSIQVGLGPSDSSTTPAAYYDTAVDGAVPGLTNEDRDTMTYINTCAEQKAILNIGGDYFHTSIPTLKSVPDSLFCKMLYKGSPFERKLPDFIDRDPKHFRIILNYLRDSGKMNTEMLPNNMRQLFELRSEAVYYQLHDLIRIVNFRISNLFPFEAGTNETLS
ncbi:hypothetical protein FSP39_011618 [Pinctada imbricata]|uniref:BTB domain-containing protein n=1 Tax=Pinctada imbricata TaxID=66713 RepID=A0AA89BSP3_PINIB|nr:hypothetical protein FSP39_011618 [Pinctada imbricata]